MKNGNLLTTIEIKDQYGRVVDTKEVVTFAGLLNRAHQEGLKSIATTLVQTPTKANDMTAISMAEVVTEKGTFRDYGDANPSNVDARIAPHIIRMAVTRAKARALRDAINVGVVALEELGGEWVRGVDNAPANAPPNTASAAPAEAPRGNGRDPRRYSRPSGKGRVQGGQSETLMSEPQRRYMFRILAEHGVAGDAAHDYLKQSLGVETLNEATKRDASDLIERLLNDPQGALKEVAA